MNLICGWVATRKTANTNGKNLSPPTTNPPNIGVRKNKKNPNPKNKKNPNLNRLFWVKGRYFIEVVSPDRDLSDASCRRKNIHGPSLILSFSTYYPEGDVEFPGEVYDVAVFNVCQQEELVLSIITDNMENRLEKIFDQDDNKIYELDFSLLCELWKKRWGEDVDVRIYDNIAFFGSNFSFQYMECPKDDLISEVSSHFQDGEKAIVLSVVCSCLLEGYIEKGLFSGVFHMGEYDEMIFAMSNAPIKYNIDMGFYDDLDMELEKNPRD